MIFFVLVVVRAVLSGLYFSGHNGHKEDTKFTKHVKGFTFE
jgi:hypothetical protein